MSVLIKGMEMPKNCVECELMVDCDGCEGWQCYCPILGEIGYLPSSITIATAAKIPTDKRHEKCPLVELPPHGRLIDADALREDIQVHAEEFVKGGHLDIVAFAQRDGLLCAADDVIYAPTIIEAEGSAE